MRTFFLLGWLTIPVAVGAYHYGPGQRLVSLDDVNTLLRDAERAGASARWPQAVDAYSQALALLPADRVADARQIKLERAKARIEAQKLPEASDDLLELVAELQEDQKADPKQLTQARAALANAQYYLTWLMRLEGLGRDEWLPVIESARQTFRMLAEQASETGESATALQWGEDLESVIRLERMEPGDLQGLPIPKQCQNCKSGQCKNKGKKPGKKPNNAKALAPPKDARGASSGPPPDNSGS